MKPLSKAILVGTVSAALTWGVVHAVIHEPTVSRDADGSINVMTICPPPDDDLTAPLWAAVAYVLTFTPTLLFLRDRTPKDVFAPEPPIG